VENEDAIESDGGALAALTVAESLLDKDAERKHLESEVEAFLASGGRIDHIPANVVADPPKKPESNYGGQPI